MRDTIEDLAPLFPFGHGLSYTTFKYSNLRLSAKSLTPAQTLKVKVEVANTGRVPGKEIVQLYVRDVKSTFARPEKELKAFQKVELKPGQTKTVTFTLDREAFWYFDAMRNAWATEAGEFEILVGASTRDIRLSGLVTLNAESRSARFHTGLTIRTLFDHPNSRAIVTKYAGGFLLMADMSMAMDMTLDQVASNHPTFALRFVAPVVCLSEFRSKSTSPHPESPIDPSCVAFVTYIHGRTRACRRAVPPGASSRYQRQLQ